MNQWKQIEEREDTLHIYTDGSKTKDGVGAGWYYRRHDQEITGKVKLHKSSVRLG